MKKKIFFVFILIIIIVFYYNNYYEQFTLKIQDAMIFLDNNDTIIGTYPDIEIYPKLFIKKNDEYVNIIGSVYDITHIKLPKPTGGLQGPIGDKGQSGMRGDIGENGLSAIDIINSNLNISPTCLKDDDTTTTSKMCKGIDGHSPQKPADGNPGEICPYSDGKCPNGAPGSDGIECPFEYGICPTGDPGSDGKECQYSNGICPTGAPGSPGACINPTGKCPNGNDGNPGKSCYDLHNTNEKNCNSTEKGKAGYYCVKNEDPPNRKLCGRINPINVQPIANNLNIDGENLIINNKTLFTNDIKLHESAKILIGGIEINKEYIDKMIQISKQCLKCDGLYAGNCPISVPSNNGNPGTSGNCWNNSNDCQQDPGECKNCTLCLAGEYVEQACSEHSNTRCKQCNNGFVGIGCSIECDPIKGEIPRDDKTACKTIGSNNYIDPNDNTKETSIPYNKYRNPNDARLLNNCSICTSGKYKTGGCSGTDNTICNCPDGKQPNDDNTDCIDCLVGTAGENGTCQECQDGKFQNEKGQSSCKDHDHTITIKYCEEVTWTPGILIPGTSTRDSRCSGCPWFKNPDVYNKCFKSDRCYQLHAWLGQDHARQDMQYYRMIETDYENSCL